jgi:putative redox protein
MRTVDVAWDQAAGTFQATGSAAGHDITINAPGIPGEPHASTGFSAGDLLLAGVGSCAAWDVVEVLRKSRQVVSSFSVRVTGEQEKDPPWTVRKVALCFTFRGRGIDRSVAERAVRLSVDRYCSAIATVRGAAEVTDTIEIIEEPAVTPA